MPPAPPAWSILPLTASLTFEPTLSVAFDATFAGLIAPLRNAVTPFLASGAAAARPAPAARPFAPDKPPFFFGFGETSPTFFTASLSAWPTASRTVSLISFAMADSPTG
jgi:hypothetical protein